MLKQYNETLLVKAIRNKILQAANYSFSTAYYFNQFTQQLLMYREYK